MPIFQIFPPTHSIFAESYNHGRRAQVEGPVLFGPFSLNQRVSVVCKDFCATHKKAKTINPKKKKNTHTLSPVNLYASSYFIFSPKSKPLFIFIFIFSFKVPSASTSRHLFFRLIFGIGVFLWFVCNCCRRRWSCDRDMVSKSTEWSQAKKSVSIFIFILLFFFCECECLKYEYK